MSNDPDAAPKWRATTNIGLISAGIASIVMMIAGEQPLSPLSLTTAIGSLFAGGLGLWERAQRRKCRAAQKAGQTCGAPGPGAGLAAILFAGMLVASVPANGCGTAFADGATKAGTCIGRCALSCATSWVGGLVDLPEPEEQYAEGSRPAMGSTLQFLVEDDSGQKLGIMGRLESWPVSGGGGLLVGYMRLEDGTLLTVLLSEEPRLYHASTAFFDAPLAPPGFEPADPPVGLQDYAARFGEPATW